MSVIIPFSTTPLFTWDRGDPRTFVLVLSGNVIGSTFDLTVSPPVNTKFLFVITQDAVGNRAFVWPTICVGAPPVGQTAGQSTIQEFVLLPGPVLKPAGPPMYD